MPKGAKDVAKRFNEHLNKMYMTICQVVCIVIFSSISIAALSVGVARQSQCPAQTKIPLWLIVYGVTGIAMSAFMILGLIVQLCCCAKSDHEKMCSACMYLLNSCIGLFVLIWSILGSVWLFSVKPSVQYNEPTEKNYCEQHMFNFAYALLIFQYVAVGLVCCLMCCFLCLGVCAMVMGDDDD